MSKRVKSLGYSIGVLALGCASAEEATVSFQQTNEALVNSEGAANLGNQAVSLTNGCSGTLLRNDVVLTAAHCVNSNGPNAVNPIDVNGNVVAGTAIAVAQKIEAGKCRDYNGLCPPGRDGDSKVDVAMVKLSSPMTVVGDSVNFVRGLFTGSSDDLVGNSMFCQGRGGTVCGDGRASNTNRWAKFNVTSVTENRMHFEAVNGQAVVTNGDSGGGCYTVISSPVSPQNQISAVISNFTCPSGTDEADSRAEPIEVIRPWVRMMLAQWATNRNYKFSSATELNGFQIVDASPSSGGPSDWKITNGALRQNKDIKGGTGTPTNAGTHALLKGNAMTNGCVETKVTSSDNDKAGIVFRYFNENFFYRFFAYEPNNVVLTRVVNGVESSVASGQKTFDWANGVKLKICMKNDELRGYLDGVQVLNVEDSAFGDGRVGLYNRLLVDANFDYFTTDNDGAFYPEF